MLSKILQLRNRKLLVLTMQFLFPFSCCKVDTKMPLFVEAFIADLWKNILLCLIREGKPFTSCTAELNFRRHLLQGMFNSTTPPPWEKQQNSHKNVTNWTAVSSTSQAPDQNLNVRKFCLMFLRTATKVSQHQTYHKTLTWETASVNIYTQTRFHEKF